MFILSIHELAQVMHSMGQLSVRSCVKNVHRIERAENTMKLVRR